MYSVWRHSRWRLEIKNIPISGSDPFSWIPRSSRSDIRRHSEIEPLKYRGTYTFCSLLFTSIYFVTNPFYTYILLVVYIIRVRSNNTVEK